MSRPTATEGGRRKRRRFLPLVWISSGAAALFLILGVNGSLSAFTASITNSANQVATGSLIMTESGPNSSGTNTTCASSSDATGNNAYSCTTINKYGSSGAAVTNLGPGDSATTTVTISNTGSVAANTFTAAFGACAQTPVAGTANPVLLAGNLCSELNVAVYQAATATVTPLFTGTLTAATTGSPLTLTAPLATAVGGAGQPYTFVVSLPAGAGNSYEGITVTQPITWTFSH